MHIPSRVVDVERPGDDEIARLLARYRRARRRIVTWDQRRFDFRREMEDPPCFGEVVLLVQDPEGRLALVRRRGALPDAFDLPTGIIQEGEGVEAAALREAAEETGRTVRVEDLPAIYQVRVQWEKWDMERWFFAVRCTAGSEPGPPPDPEEIENVTFVRLPDGLPRWWAHDEWWGGRWRHRILEDAGLLPPGDSNGDTGQGEADRVD